MNRHHFTLSGILNILLNKPTHTEITSLVLNGEAEVVPWCGNGKVWALKLGAKRAKPASEFIYIPLEGPLHRKPSDYNAISNVAKSASLSR